MWKATRCLLTGLLATLMIVDSAAAGRLFRRTGCRHKCHCRCVVKCPATCCVVECPVVHCPAVLAPCGAVGDCVPAVGSSEVPTYYDDTHSVVSEPTNHDTSVASPATVEDPAPTPEVDDMFLAPLPTPLAPAPVAVPTTPAVVDAPVEETPSVTPTAPTTEEEDDLFAPTPPERETSSETGDDLLSPVKLNDIFDEPTTAAEEPTSDPRPAEEMPPVEATPPEESDTEAEYDLFGEQSDDDPTEEPTEEPADKPTDKPVEQAPESDETEKPEDEEPASFEDIFGQDGVPAVLRELGGLQSSATRTWTDDTALFRCEARLSRVTSTAVHLLKSNGRTAAVPLARMSTGDLRFVERQVVAMRDVLAKRAVVQQLASAQAN